MEVATIEVSVEVTAIHYIKNYNKNPPTKKKNQIKTRKIQNHAYLHFPSYLEAAASIEAVACLVVVDLTLDVEAYLEHHPKK